MIKFEHVRTYNWLDAIRGMRNSWESWDKIDSREYFDRDREKVIFELGESDNALMMRLVRAGSDHAKFMRQIVVSVDITAPLYFFKQFDQYKVGTVTNSTSTMHTIQRKEFEHSMFSVEDLDEEAIGYFQDYLDDLNLIRGKFLETKDKRYWRMLIQMLPDSFNQTRTTTLNYAVLRAMYHSRKNHRLSEWHNFCAFCETLPHSELITYVPKKRGE